MGPRPWRRGEKLAGLGERNALYSFNGAAPLEARREFCVDIGGHFSSEALQWGRAPGGAERRPGVALGAPGLAASMGPRPWRRGESHRHHHQG